MSSNDITDEEKSKSETSTADVMKSEDNVDTPEAEVDNNGDTVNPTSNSENTGGDCNKNSVSDSPQIESEIGHKRKSAEENDTDRIEEPKKVLHVEKEKPAVEAGHGYLNNMDITKMTYEEYLVEFKELQERSKAKYQQAQKQLRQLEQQHEQQQRQQRQFQQQHMFMGGGGPMGGGPMGGGPMGGGPMGIGPMGGGPMHMGMGPGHHMGPGPPFM